MARMRSKTNRRKDKRIFKKTVNKTKTINVRPLAMRGGIRL